MRARGSSDSPQGEERTADVRFSLLYIHRGAPAWRVHSRKCLRKEHISRAAAGESGKSPRSRLSSSFLLSLPRQSSERTLHRREGFPVAPVPAAWKVSHSPIVSWEVGSVSLKVLSEPHSFARLLNRTAQVL